MEPTLRYALQGLLDGLRKTGALTDNQLAVVIQSIADAGTEAGRVLYTHSEDQCHSAAKSIARDLGVQEPTIHQSRPNRMY